MLQSMVCRHVTSKEPTGTKQGFLHDYALMKEHQLNDPELMIAGI